MNRISSFWRNKEFKKWDKTQWILIGLAGILLMVIAIPADVKKETGGNEVSQQYGGEVNDSLEYAEYGQSQQKQLKKLLENIEGVGKTEVMITYEDYGRDGNTPVVKGIIVAAQGACDSKVKENIIDIIMSLFQIDMNRIKVVKMITQEG